MSVMRGATSERLGGAAGGDEAVSAGADGGLGFMGELTRTIVRSVVASMAENLRQNGMASKRVPTPPRTRRARSLARPRRGLAESQAVHPGIFGQAV
jgi:hypothetical protein